MSSPPQSEATAEQAAESAQQNPPPKARRKNIRPPLPDDFKELCALCRVGKLFAIQEWFKTHKYDEPERYCRHWPLGIAIEKGFHSLVEVLLQNGIPPDGSALQHAVSYRNKDIIELLLQHGADVNSIDFGEVVYVSDPTIIRLFIDLGADVLTNYPIARGLIHATRLFLGIYKSYIGKYPQLLVKWFTTLRQKEWLGALTPPVEDQLQKRIGISTQHGDRDNFGVYLSMLAEEITEKTEWKVSVHEWKGGWGGAAHRLLVKRKATDVDDITRRIQLWGLEKGKLLRPERVKEMLHSLLEENAKPKAD